MAIIPSHHTEYFQNSEITKFPDLIHIFAKISTFLKRLT